MKKVAMKEEPAASGFLNDENDKIDDENDNEAEKAKQDYIHRQHVRQEQEVEEDFQQKIDRQKMTARQPRTSEPHRHHGAAGGKCGSNSLRSSRTQNSTIPKMKSKDCEEQ